MARLLNSTRQQAGITLTESLVALLLMGISLSGLTRLYVETVRATSHAKGQSEAITLAEARLEALRQVTEDRAYGREPLEGDSTVDGSHARYRLHWQTTPSLTQPLYRVSVTARWADQSGEHVVSLDSHIPATAPIGPDWRPTDLD